MQVTYIANEGFLVVMGDKKILVDALFGKLNLDWCDVPSGDVIERMERCIEPFEGIEVILVTHAHVDNFDAEIVANHWKLTGPVSWSAHRRWPWNWKNAIIMQNSAHWSGKSCLKREPA